MCFPDDPMPLSHVDKATSKELLAFLKQTNSSNVGSPSCSVPDHDAMGTRPCNTREEQIKDLSELLLPIARNVSNFEGHVQTITSTEGLIATMVASLEQHVTAPAARMCAFETGAASASGVSGPPTGSRMSGPANQALWMNTEVRNGNLKQAWMKKTHEAPFSHDSLANQVVQAFTLGSPKQNSGKENDDEVHCKNGGKSVRLVFAPKARCQQFVQQRRWPPILG